jgi:hypothetical protein
MDEPNVDAQQICPNVSMVSCEATRHGIKATIANKLL